jgi:2'-5' RNA ligase
VRDRVARTDWLAVGKDEAAFTESPAGLVRWAPVMDELKELDEEIVRNSVRFRWQEVRRDFSRHLDLQAVLGALPGPPNP